MKAEERIINRAVQFYGHTSQIDMMIEEMSELTKALLKHRRGPADEAAREAVREEMADVEIMLQQMKIIFGEPVIWKRNKLERLANRLGLQKEREADDECRP